MSDLSEAAYTAGWMSGLEFVLWDAVVNGPRTYGYITITHEHIQQLRRLSELAGGWILFDDEQEEILMTFKTWKQRFAERQPALSLCRRRLDPGVVECALRLSRTEERSFDEKSPFHKRRSPVCERSGEFGARPVRGRLGIHADRGLTRLLRAPRDIDAGTPGPETLTMRGNANAALRAVCDNYRRASPTCATMRWWRGCIAAAQHPCMLRDDAIDEAYALRTAGPASAPKCVWFIRHFLLRVDAINRELPFGQRVAPQDLLAKWVADSGVELDTAMRAGPSDSTAPASGVDRARREQHIATLKRRGVVRATATTKFAAIAN